VTGYVRRLARALDLAIGDLLDAAYRLATAPIHVLADPPTPTPVTDDDATIHRAA
jgi:hypothetical protein